MAKRKAIPEKTKTALLEKCKRRCCMCYHLDNDTDQKDGQIAHIDRDSSNNEENNLVYLCLKHHNLYDTKFSQTKSYSQDEIRRYKAILIGYIKSSNLVTDSYDDILKNENESSPKSKRIQKDLSKQKIIWNDPVWSKVIAGLILFIITSLIVFICSNSSDTLENIGVNSSYCQDGFGQDNSDSLKILILRFNDEMKMNDTTPECIGTSFKRILEELRDSERLEIDVISQVS